MGDITITANRRAERVYGLRIETRLLGEGCDTDGFGHYEWHVTLRRVNVINSVDHPFATRTLTYRMGLGHIQTPCGRSLQFGQGTPCHHVRCQGKRVPTPPDLYSVVGSLRGDATHGATFAEWCGDYGYSTDSRKTMDLYLACQKSEDESRAFFGDDWPKILDDESFD